MDLMVQFAGGDYYGFVVHYGKYMLLFLLNIIKQARMQKNQTRTCLLNCFIAIFLALFTASLYNQNVVKEIFESPVRNFQRESIVRVFETYLCPPNSRKFSIKLLVKNIFKVHDFPNHNLTTLKI